MNDTIEKEQYYAHPIEQVWAAITESDQISQWFLQTDFKAEVGTKYTLTYDRGVITGTVKEVNPVFDLVYSWIVGTEGVETLVRWRLEEKDGGTLLKLVHSGISNYEGVMATEMLGNFNDGWNRCIRSLGEFLN